MRTTLNIDDDVLNAAKEIGRRRRKTAGEVISELARRGLTEGASTKAPAVRGPKASYGFAPLPARGVVITDALVNRLREEVGD